MARIRPYEAKDEQVNPLTKYHKLKKELKTAQKVEAPNLKDLRLALVNFIVRQSSEKICEILFFKKKSFLFRKSPYEFIFLLKSFPKTENGLVRQILNKASSKITAKQQDKFVKHLMEPTTFLRYINAIGFESIQPLLKKEICELMLAKYHQSSYIYHDFLNEWIPNPEAIIESGDYLKLLNQCRPAIIKEIFIFCLRDGMGRKQNSLIIEASYERIANWIEILGPFNFGDILCELNSNYRELKCFKSLREKEMPDKISYIQDLLALMDDPTSFYKEKSEEFLITIAQYIPLGMKQSLQSDDSNTTSGIAVLQIIAEFISKHEKIKIHLNPLYAFLAILCHNEQLSQLEKNNLTEAKKYELQFLAFLEKISSMNLIQPNYNYVIGEKLLNLVESNKEFELRGYEHLYQAAHDNHKSAIKLLRKIIKSTFIPTATLFAPPAEIKAKIKETKEIYGNLEITDIDTEVKTPILELKAEAKQPRMIKKSEDQFLPWTLNDNHLYHSFIAKHKLQLTQIKELNLAKTATLQIQAEANHLINSPQKVEAIEKLRTILILLENKENLQFNLPAINGELTKLADKVLLLFTNKDKKDEINAKFDVLKQTLPSLIKALTGLSPNHPDLVTSNLTSGISRRL